MGQLEPLSSIPRSRSHIFFIGKDGSGNWVVQDEQHLCGGLSCRLYRNQLSSLFEVAHGPIQSPGL
jgi:hypothetical protein